MFRWCNTYVWGFCISIDEELGRELKSLSSNIKDEIYVAIINRILGMDICPMCNEQLKFITNNKENCDELNTMNNYNVKFIYSYPLKEMFKRTEEACYVCLNCRQVYNRRFQNVNRYYVAYWNYYDETHKRVFRCGLAEGDI